MPVRMSQRKRILRALSRIGHPKANEFEGDIFEWLFDCEFVLFLEWFYENIQETNVLSPEELNRLVHLFFSGLTFVLRNVNLGNWSLLVCSKRTHLFSLPGVGVGRVGGVGYRRHYLGLYH